MDRSEFRLPLLLLLAAGCAAGRGAASYGPEDPLSRRPKPETVYRVVRSSAGAPERVPAFRAVIPAGYEPSEGVLHPPIAAILTKRLYRGEASIVAERYDGSSGPVDREGFIRNLGPEPAGKYRSTRRLGGKEYEVYQGIELESFADRIPPADPYLGSLGAAYKPPRLSLFESRRFPAGGDAYRLFRCRKRGAWGILGDYRRALGSPSGAESFVSSLEPLERKTVSACFGQDVLLDMRAGRSLPRIPKPSMYRLRIMARDEWTHGASRVLERMSVHLRPFEGGFWALRFTAPEQDYKDEQAAFDLFLGSFEEAGR